MRLSTLIMFLSLPFLTGCWYSERDLDFTHDRSVEDYAKQGYYRVDCLGTGHVYYLGPKGIIGSDRSVSKFERIQVSGERFTLYVVQRNEADLGDIHATYFLLKPIFGSLNFNIYRPEEGTPILSKEDLFQKVRKVWNGRTIPQGWKSETCTRIPSTDKLFLEKTLQNVR